MSQPFHSLAASLRYGYALQYIARIEGIPTLLCEYGDPVIDGTVIVPTDDDISTQSTSSNGQRAVFFDVDPQLDGFEVRGFTIYGGASSGSFSLDVYHRADTVVGHTGSSTGWTLIETIGPLPVTLNQPQTFMLSTPLAIPQGVNGFALQGSSNVRYTTVGAPTVFSDSNVQITTYYGSSGLFGGTLFTFRSWDGTLLYTTPVEVPGLDGDPDAPGAMLMPEGYTTDNSLIIDTSAKIGSVIDQRTHLGAAYDFTFRFLDSPTIRSMFVRPSFIGELAEDLAEDAVSAVLVDATGLPASGILYVGTSAIPYTGVTDNTVTGLTQGVYGRAKRYGARTIVSSSPRFYVGRETELLAVVIDPCGRYVQGVDILSEASLLWRGYVAERPTRAAATWELQARSIERRLAEPLSPAMEGTAWWDLGADHRYHVSPPTLLTVTFTGFPVAEIDSVTFKPWASLAGGLHPFSVIRSTMKAAWDALTDAEGGPLNPIIGVMTWRETIVDDSAGQIREWRAFIDVDPDDTAGSGLVFTEAVIQHQWGGLPPFGQPGGRNGMANVPNDGFIGIPTSIARRDDVNTATLSIDVDGDPADLATSGWVQLEAGDDRTEMYRYVDIEVDAEVTSRAHLTLHPSTPANLVDLASQDAAGQLAEVGATFLFRDTGSVPDIMRRRIASSGVAGANGTYDTGPRGSGYAINGLDEASFDRVFDGLFRTFSADIAVESDADFIKLFADLMRLSRRGVAAVPSEDGGAIQIAAVNLGAPEGAVATATITDRDLAWSDSGGGPVRAARIEPPPDQIHLDLEVPGKSPGPLVLRHAGSEGKEYGRRGWKGTIFGIDRDAFNAPATGWARSIFITSETRQLIEVDVVPWLPVRVGDVVAVRITDPHLWTYSTGEPGYDGLGRVWGAQTKLTTGIMTLTIEIDGDAVYAPLSPSAPIEDYTWVETSLAWVDVPREYYAVMASYLADEESFSLSLYLPGEEGALDAATLTIDGVTDTGSACRLSVSSSVGAEALTEEGWHLTLPALLDCNAEQAKYLHVGQSVQWS